MEKELNRYRRGMREEILQKDIDDIINFYKVYKKVYEIKRYRRYCLKKKLIEREYV